MAHLANEKTVSVVGSANYDSTFYLDELPRPGQTLLSRSRLEGPGGKGANQAVAIAAQNAPVDFLTCLGDDSTGEFLLRYFADRGVGVSAIEKLDGYPTGAAVVLVSASGENEIIVDPGANSGLSVSAVTSWLPGRESHIVLAQLEIPFPTVLAASMSHPGLFILNPAPLRSRSDELEEILSHTDLLVPNRTELAALVGVGEPSTPNDVESAVSKLAFDGQVVVTLGSDGAMVFPDGPRGGYVTISAPRVKAVDTSGAGDAFCGGLAVALAHGADLVEASRHAVSLASWSVTQRGAQLGVVPKNYLFHLN